MNYLNVTLPELSPAAEKVAGIVLLALVLFGESIVEWLV